MAFNWDNYDEVAKGESKEKASAPAFNWDQRPAADVDDGEPRGLGQELKKYAEDYVIDQLPGLGAAGGGMVAGALATPGTLGAGTVPAALAGAGAGAYLGKSLQNAYNYVARPELAPKSNIEAIAGPLEEGAMGASLEGAGQMAGQAAGKAISSPTGQRVLDFIKKRAKLGAYKALAPIKGVAQKDLETGQAEYIGAQLLEDEAIPYLGTPERIASRVEKLKKSSGEEIGNIVDRANTNTAPYSPVSFEHEPVGFQGVKFKKPKFGNPVNEEVRVTPVSFNESPTKQAFPWLRDADTPASIMTKGDEQVLEHVMYDPKTVVIPGKETTVPGPLRSVTKGEVLSPLAEGMTADVQKITDSVMASKDFQRLKNQYGTKSARAALEEYLTNIGAKGKVGMRELQELRQDVDAGINFGKRSDDLSPGESVLYNTRTKIRDAMNEIANRLEGTSKDALLRENRRYSNLERASDILDKKMAGDLSNRTIGLTDSLAAGVGFTKAGGPGAVAAAAVNKGIRTFGRSFSARSLQDLSKVIESSPELLGKYAGPLTQAARSGAESLQVMHKILSADPEYQDQIKKISEGGQ